MENTTFPYTEALAEHQKAYVRQKLDKATQAVLLTSIGVPFIFLILAFIPANRIPSRRGGRVETTENILQMFGFPVVLFILLGGVLLFLYLNKEYRWLKLKEDAVDLKKTVFQAKVQHLDIKRFDDGVRARVFLNKKINGKPFLDFIDYPLFPTLYQRDTVQIEMTQHAGLPLHISKIDGDGKPEDSVQEALRILQNVTKKG